MDLRIDRIDMRTVPAPQRHQLLFGSFDALAPGEALEFLNDHDPLPLYEHMDASRPGQFEWSYLEAGPQQWHVRIGRVAAVD